MNVFNGAMWHEFVDFSLRGRTEGTSIVFKRNYLTKSVTTDSDFGPGWHHAFETKLLSTGTGSAV